MSRFLIVTWDGAGNLVSALGIAERLARRHHDVRILGHPSIGGRIEERGWRFRSFRLAPPWDSTAPGDPTTENEALAGGVWFNPAVADEVMAELDREPADVLVVDCMLYTALVAGEARRLPTAALFHAAISPFRGGPLFDAFSQGLPGLNQLRHRVGLPEVASITDIHDACALSLVVAPREFDVDVPLPESVRFVGPVLDGPPINRAVEPVSAEDGAVPLVVVSFSTSYQAQQARLQDVVDALSGSATNVIVTTGSAVGPDELSVGGNVRAARFVDHGRLVPKASVVVTHGGMGTLMTALSHGVPVVCVPMGRDQFFNAAMVDRLGVGRVVPPDGGPDSIRSAVTDVLAGDGVRGAAKAFAAVMAGYRGAAEAVEELERLARDARA